MLFKKKNIVELTQYYSLLWSEKEPIVRFNHVFDLIKECDLTVVDMTYRSASHLVDDRCMITFGLKGTIQNLELFGVKCLHNPNLKIFDNTAEEES